MCVCLCFPNKKKHLLGPEGNISCCFVFSQFLLKITNNFNRKPAENRQIDSEQRKKKEMH